MNAVLAIARREVHERRSLLAAALILGLLPVALKGLLPVEDVGELLAILAYLAFPTAVALAVGASIVGRDVAERRLGFYFSQPLSAGALWAGKFLGGAMLVAAAYLACGLSVQLATGRGPGQGSGGISAEALLVGLLVQLLLMSGSHVVSSMYRSRSPLFALDLVVAALFAALLTAQIRHLVLAGAAQALMAGFGLYSNATWDAPFGLPTVTVIAGTAIMLAAAFAQLAHGRADARRGHAALSATLWPLAFAFLGAFGLWGVWLLRVTPGDVGGAGSVALAPRGTALFFTGAKWEGRAGFNPSFLIDGEDGSYVRLPAERMSTPTFSADGKRAAWVVDPEPVLGHEHALVVARLDRRPPQLEPRRLDLREPPRRVLALEAGGHLALLTGDSSLYLVDAGRGTPYATLATADVVAADFLSDGTLRLYQLRREPRAATTLAVLDWKPKEGEPVERVRVTGEGWRTVLHTRRGDIAVTSTSAHSKAILDASSGSVTRIEGGLPKHPGVGPVALVLSSGNIAISFEEGVRIVSRAGATVASVPVEPSSGVYTLRETAPGELAVGVSGYAFDRRRTVFVDAATGAVRREEPGLLPPFSFNRPAPEPGSFASRLFVDLDGALLLLEPDGTRREIVKAAE